MSHLSFNSDYVRRLTLGDEEVQKHFVTHFSTLLRIKLRTRLRSRQLIEDVRQETFLRVLQTLKKENGLQKPERLGAFVNSVCNNVMLESFRAEGRHTATSDDAPEIIDDGADDPIFTLITAEREQLVSKVLDEMSSKDRDLIKKVFFEERDKDSICKELGINQEYLRVLIHRAKARFRAALNTAKDPKRKKPPNP